MMKAVKIFSPLTALLFAFMAIVTISTVTAGRVEAATSSGNIIDNRITSARIDPATSIATIGGLIQCSTSTQVMVYGWASQVRTSHHPVQSYGGTHLTCGTTPTAYVVTLNPGYESGRLVPGTAVVGFWAEYCADGQCYGRNTESEMRLEPAR